LFETGGIDLNRGAIIDYSPGPMPHDFDFGRVEGMMLGLAIGDALGNTTEGMLPHQRKARFGEIRDYIPRPGIGVGLPSDDTQLAFWTLEQMIEDGGFVPEHVASRFSRGRIFGIGGTVRQFLANYKSGKPWYECGPKSAGNGALMRIAPMLIPHLKTGTSALWVDAALSAMMTHNDSVSTASCLAFVRMLWELLRMDGPPEPRWWLRTFVDTARDLECDESYTPRGGAYQGYRGPVWKFVQEKVGDAYDRGVPVVEACNRWYSGAFILETVPSVIYILMRHAHDPEEALVRAVNDTLDNDTIGAIVGAAVGALHGREGLPKRWIDNHSGRTNEADDGRIFTLVAAARQSWWAVDSIASERPA
jgi:ADP-ribosylglycohydrolase